MLRKCILRKCKLHKCILRKYILRKCAYNERNSVRVLLVRSNLHVKVALHFSKCGAIKLFCRATFIIPYQSLPQIRMS